MKIDMKPLIETANETDRIVLEMRKIEALYVVRTKNWEELTVKFDKKGLDEFLPERNISDMLLKWEAGFIRNYDELMDALHEGIHPWFKNKEEILHPITEQPTGKYKDVDRPLTKSEAKSFLKQAEEIKQKFGKLTFVKIV